MPPSDQRRFSNRAIGVLYIGRRRWHPTVCDFKGAAAVIIWWVGGLLGALGGAVADASKVATTMLTTKQWPWTKPEQRWPFLTALLLRTGCAAALPAVVAAQKFVGLSDQPLILFLLGLAAPTLVQHVARIARVCLKALLGEYSAGGGGGGVV